MPGIDVNKTYSRVTSVSASLSVQDKSWGDLVAGGGSGWTGSLLKRVRRVICLMGLCSMPSPAEKLIMSLPTIIDSSASHCTMTQVLCGGNCSDKLICKGHAHWVARSRPGKRHIVSADGIIPGRKYLRHDCIQLRNSAGHQRAMRYDGCPRLVFGPVHCLVCKSPSLSSACFLIPTECLPLSHSAGS